jgi:hypothetical protein
MQRLKIILYIVLLFVFIFIGVLLYLYQHGGVENYIPPKTKVESPRIQVMNESYDTFQGNRSILCQ